MVLSIYIEDCRGVEVPGFVNRRYAEIQTNIIEAQEEWFKAVEANDIDKVIEMVNTSEINPNIKDDSPLRETALHIAAKDPRKSEMAGFLINHHSVDINATDVTGATPLFGAIKTGNNTIIDLLLRHEKIKLRVQDDSSTTSHPLTPVRLLIACRTPDEVKNVYLPYLRRKGIKLTDNEYRDMKNIATGATAIEDTRKWIDIIVEHMIAERAAS
jgi:ankyrin repeat protein